uniref:Pancreatic trypsin inhibitor n=1 Tax=Rhipicephalus zambeziensis TaxID=60191 RepID=A0A224YCQ1_9ACAR
MKMDVNIKALHILMVAGISIAWSPIAQPAGTTGPSQAVPAVPGNTFLSDAGNGGSSSFPQRILQLPVNRPVPPQRGGERPSSYQQPGIQGQVTRGMMPLPVQQQGIPNLPTPSLHQQPSAPGSSFLSQSNTVGAPPFPQQVPHTQQLPASGPMTPQQNGATASSNQQQGTQWQTTPGMMPSSGQQLWISNPSAPSFQRPGATSSRFASESNTGRVAQFPQQISQMPQLPASRQMKPQQSGNTPSYNHQQVTLGQIGSGTMLSPARQPSNPNTVGSTTSEQRPQLPSNGIFPQVNTQIQGPRNGPQFSQQSGQQPWNGPRTSQQSSPNQSNHAIAQSFSNNHRGSGTPSVSNQRPGEQSWRGHVGSQIPQQNAQQQWSYGVVPPNSSQTPLQQSGSGVISTSPQPQWGGPSGSPSIPHPGQQQQWGSGNVPQNLQQHSSAQITPSVSQQGQQMSLRSGASAGGQQQSTAAQQANGAGPSNRSTHPPRSGQVTTVSSQGLQQSHSYSGRGGISPVGQQNVTAQRTDGTSLPTQRHPAQPSLNGQLPSQLWKKRVRLLFPQTNTQEQQINGLLSQLLKSLPTTSPSEITKQSIHRRVVSIHHQTVQRSLRRQSVSTSSRR